jgi:hypothetical protein
MNPPRKPQPPVPCPGIDPMAVLEAWRRNPRAGFCTCCAREYPDCEPDSWDKPCETCGTPTVCGAHALLFLTLD